MTTVCGKAQHRSADSCHARRRDENWNCRKKREQSSDCMHLTGTCDEVGVTSRTNDSTGETVRQRDAGHRNRNDEKTERRRAIRGIPVVCETVFPALVTSGLFSLERTATGVTRHRFFFAIQEGIAPAPHRWNSVNLHGSVAETV